ncbi:MAG: RsmB/NOP family class I SAM-dependent RNA methyltransferase [Alphaproteobacteria bacterium]|nr:RsmB/NOP family class I SAM-dependent RNA methyltransferase [Alphaproteobacteria bacterium]
MQTSARYQAVFELLCKIFKNQVPADVLINTYMRARKYIGAKDRRFILETTWDIIRHRLRLEFDAKSEDVRRVLLCYLQKKGEDFDLITGGTYGLEALSKEEKSWLKNLKSEPYPLNVELECPQWLMQKIDNPALVALLNQKANVDIRANFISPYDLKKRLEKEGLFFSLTAYSPFGLRTSENINLNNCTAYHEGLFDIQDEACQVAALLCDVKVGEKVIDYCAGAGGKTLALCAITENRVLIEAHDVNFKRMSPIKERARRLGATNIKLISKLQALDYDCFIADCPCSGSGTWRRAPDLKFRTSSAHLEDLQKIQSDVLQVAYQHTKSGGRIVYMTCSVLREENEDVVEKFVNKHGDIQFFDHEKLWEKKIDVPYPFSSKKYLNFSPLLTNTDGFFFCCLKKD